MANYMYGSDVVFDVLLQMSSNIVWKDPKYAIGYESGENSIEVEQYNLARQGRLTFDMIYSLDEEPLRQLGFSEELISSCMDDIYAVPEQYRETLTKLQQEYTLTHYEEMNNYYRRLNGLPDVEDTDFLYNIKYPNISGSTTPIHELALTQLQQLERVGYIDDLIKKNPKKKYLKHLTEKKIDIYVARNTPDYGLLYVPPTELVGLQDEFRDTYEKCRAMVSSVYRIKNLSVENTEYHGFIGIVILFATINQMHQKILNADITRDFFDTESLRCVYESYGVPFFSKIPVEYHREIVKNINRLISLKGSTKCIYELFDIFGFSTIDIYEFYMLRMHRFENGKPVFHRKEDGSYDYERMFDVRFAKCRLHDDPSSEVSKFVNHVGYDEMTRSDPYWITDRPLADLIYKSSYNFVDSKYLGVQTSFELMQILYEGSFFIKMILDNREKLSTTPLYYKNIRSNCNVFDFIIYVCCIMCRKNGLAGNIATYPHQIGKFLGFDFKKDLSIIIRNISDNDYLKNDQTLISLLKMTDINSLESVTRVYGKIVKLRKYLTNKMHETHDRDVYFAYYELYNMLMYSEYVEDIFKKSDGTTASTFEDLLEDLNPTLYTRYTHPELYNENEEISDLLYTMELHCSELKLIHFADDLVTNAVFEYIFKLINFFKSAEVSLTGYDIVLSLALNSENMMKLLAAIDHVVENTNVDSIYDELTDLISSFSETKKLQDAFIWLVDEICHLEERGMYIDSVMRLEDRLCVIADIIHKMTSSITFVEDLSRSISVNLPPDSLGMEDQVMLLRDRVMEVIVHFIEDGFELPDTIVSIAEHAGMNIHLSDPNDILKLRQKKYNNDPLQDIAEENAHSIYFMAQLTSLVLCEKLDVGKIGIEDQLLPSVEKVMVSFGEYLYAYLSKISENTLTGSEYTFLEKIKEAVKQSFDPCLITLGDDLFQRESGIANTAYMTFLDVCLECFYVYWISVPHVLEDEITAIQEYHRANRIPFPLTEDVHEVSYDDPRNSLFSITDCLILEAEHVMSEDS